MDRFIKRITLACGQVFSTKGRRRHTDEPSAWLQNRQQITKKIVSDDDIKLFRRADKLHGAVINIHARVPTFAFSLVQGRHHFTPETPECMTLLFDTCQTAITLARQIKGNAADTFDFRRRVEIGIKGTDHAVCIRITAARLSEINATCEFPHDHDIKPETTSGFSVDAETSQGKPAPDAIGKIISYAGQQTALRFQIKRQIIILRATNSTEQHCIRCHCIGKCLINRHTMGIIGRPANKALGK